MSAPKQMHVAANIPQDFTNEEKAQARENIGAAAPYTAGYGIAIDGQRISKTHHKLMATNNISYQYCKVFDFTWQYIYGRGQCVFTATHYGGDYVTFAVSATRALGANYTIAWPYVVSASPDMAKSYAFVERLEIREIGSRIVGYLKLRNFSQNQFWLDWEGSSNAGILSFTPELTNSPEGDIAWTCTVSNYDVPFTQYEVNNTFQKKLYEGAHIDIDSDGVISAYGFMDKFEAVYGTTTYSEINNALAAGKEVVLRIEDGADDVSYATFGGAYSDPEYNEYYFYSLGKGAQDTVYRVNNINAWTTFTPNDADGRVFIAEYDTTTFSTIQNAINNGKYVVTKRGTQYYTMIHNFDARVVFESKLSLGWNSANFCEVDSDNVWTMYSSTAPVTTFAEHGSVITTDAWNEVDNTTSFVLAQKGTHGGTMQVGVKLGTGGWTGSYKVFTRLFHNSTSSSAPDNGTTEFSTVTLNASDFTFVGSVPQYMLQTNVQWTYIVEVAYSASPGRSVRFTLSGIGASDITFLAEEIR